MRNSSRINSALSRNGSEMGDDDRMDLNTSSMSIGKTLQTKNKLRNKAGAGLTIREAS